MVHRTNKAETLELMDDTRASRQKWIKSSQNVTLQEILEKFPRFQDFKGELVNIIRNFSN